MTPLPISHMPGCRKQREKNSKKSMQRGKAKASPKKQGSRETERESRQGGTDRRREGGIREGTAVTLREGRVPCVP